MVSARLVKDILQVNAPVFMPQACPEKMARILRRDSGVKG